MTYFCTLTRLRWLAFVGLIVVLTLAGCRGSAPDAAKTPGAPAAGTVADLPVVESSGVIKADQGGAITLNDRARLTVPQGALSTDARVTFTRGNTAPDCPDPAHAVGPRL